MISMESTKPRAGVSRLLLHNNTSHLSRHHQGGPLPPTTPSSASHTSADSHASFPFPPKRQSVRSSSILHRRLLQLQAALDPPPPSSLPTSPPPPVPVETAPPTTSTTTPNLSARQELHDTLQAPQQQERQPTPGKKQAIDKGVRHLESALKKAARENQQLTDNVKKLEAALALAKNQKTAREGLGMRHAQRAERVEEALVDTKRTLTTFRSAAQGRDVRLQRLQEEEKRLKAALIKEQVTRKEEVGRAQAASKRLERQVRQLEKEKEGLRVAFGKQGELVEVLRRQMQHVQAAQLLSFTEKDFNRLVRDWQHRGHQHNQGRE